MVGVLLERRNPIRKDQPQACERQTQIGLISIALQNVPKGLYIAPCSVGGDQLLMSSAGYSGSTSYLCHISMLPDFKKVKYLHCVVIQMTEQSKHGLNRRSDWETKQP